MAESDIFQGESSYKRLVINGEGESPSERIAIEGLERIFTENPDAPPEIVYAAVQDVADLVEAQGIEEDRGTKLGETRTATELVKAAADRIATRNADPTYAY